MTGLTFNGKPFDPKDFEEALLRAAREKVADHVQETMGAIRDPDTGEFPTVVTSMDEAGNIGVRIEGSPEVLDVVQSRLIHAGTKRTRRKGQRSSRLGSSSATAGRIANLRRASPEP